MTQKKTSPSSGQYGTLASRKGADGSVEYVFDDTPQGLDEISAAGMEQQDHSRTPTTPEPRRNMGAIAAICALLAIMGVGVALALSGGEEDPMDEDVEVEEQGFKAYDGAARARQAPARQETEDDIPEELAGWDLEDSDEEVIVIEESHPDEVGAAAAAVQEPLWQPRTPENSPLNLDEIRTTRRANMRQRELLQRMNDDLEEGRVKPFNKELPAGLRNPAQRFPTNFAGPDPAAIQLKAAAFKQEARRQQELEAEQARQKAIDDSLPKVTQPLPPAVQQELIEPNSIDTTEETN